MSSGGLAWVFASVGVPVFFTTYLASTVVEAK